jgi:putative endonuclease
MFSIYVLRNVKNGKRYVGYTSKNPHIRLIEHNLGCTASTRRRGPFDLLHTEQYETKAEALIREKFLKSGQGRKLLDTMFPPSSAGRAGGCKG